jgi:hypothetical protein
VGDFITNSNLIGKITDQLSPDPGDGACLCPLPATIRATARPETHRTVPSSRTPSVNFFNRKKNHRNTAPFVSIYPCTDYLSLLLPYPVLSSVWTWGRIGAVEQSGETPSHSPVPPASSCICSTERHPAAPPPRGQSCGASSSTSASATAPVTPPPGRSRWQ